ncbi:exo-alpha-sialidase [Acidipila sp. EB88]|uniref:sialidase family protein n=1 Tax=Acidipila sp. EB88 TaxID=2305226 RepID=UPI0018F72385|nr:sialidase family protein [Acidipila sp. EB88]
MQPQAAGQPHRTLQQQDIFTDAPFASCHASTVVELRNGDWLAAWFGGSAEGKPDVAIWSSRHTAAGWSKPAQLVREPAIASWNPVLFHAADGTLWLYYKFGPVAAGWTGARMQSADDGRTWSAPEHLPAGILGPIRAKPYVATDGTIVSGSSVESYHSWAAWIERSSDNGATTQKSGPYTLTDPAIQQLTGKAPLPDDTTGLIQPSVVPLGDHLRFYARSTNNIGRICAADSRDGGRTWTPPHALDLANPNSGIDAVHLRDGRIVLIYNPTASGRSPLALAVSRDGEHFQRFQTLEDDPGQEFSYPALIQLADGDLLMTYTWHRTRIRAVRLPLAQVP